MMTKQCVLQASVLRSASRAHSSCGCLNAEVHVTSVTHNPSAADALVYPTANYPGWGGDMHMTCGRQDLLHKHHEHPQYPTL